MPTSGVVHTDAFSLAATLKISTYKGLKNKVFSDQILVLTDTGITLDKFYGAILCLFVFLCVCSDISKLVPIYFIC